MRWLSGQMLTVEASRPEFDPGTHIKVEEQEQLHRVDLFAPFMHVVAHVPSPYTIIDKGKIRSLGKLQMI